MSERSTELDMQKCVEATNGNRFELVILAASRAREIRRQHAHSDKFEHVHTTVTALLEFQNGTIDKKYLNKK